jgi:hypothetical protein
MAMTLQLLAFLVSKPRLFVFQQSNRGRSSRGTRLCYVAVVDSSKLTDQQIAQLTETVTRYLRFVGRLRQRMDRLHFPPHDRLYTCSIKAYNSLHEMHVELHYLSVKGGVGRDPRLNRTPSAVDLLGDTAKKESPNVSPAHDPAAHPRHHSLRLSHPPSH